MDVETSSVQFLAVAYALETFFCGVADWWRLEALKRRIRSNASAPYPYEFELRWKHFYPVLLALEESCEERYKAQQRAKELEQRIAKMVAIGRGE